ncbi:MAG: hypothetical protein ACLT8E_05090 [Akkermansia sp.]
MRSWMYGEARSDLNLFDYHIGFDSADHGGALEMPLSSYRVQADQPLENVADALNRKSGFCNYIYSHGEASYRIQLFSSFLNTRRSIP